VTKPLPILKVVQLGSLASKKHPK